jgi:hypothetical protein
MKGITYFISPISGRIIKSTGKVYEKLKKKRYLIDKHPCFYNINSVKKCLGQMLSRYNSILPSTRFMKMNHPAFIKHHKKNTIKGIITKSGKLHKLSEYQSKKIQEIKSSLPIVETINSLHSEILNTKLKSEGTSLKNTDFFKMIETVPEKIEDQNKVLFNPIQDDFIPIKKTDEVIPTNKEILKSINNTLIPQNLPSINKTKISGIIQSTQNPNHIIGYVDSENNTKRFETPVLTEENIQTEPSEPEASDATQTEPSEVSEATQSEPSETEAISETEPSEAELSETEPSEAELSELSETSKAKVTEEKVSNLIDMIPKLEISSDQLLEIPKSSEEEKKEFTEVLKSICQDGEELDNLTGKCFKCDYYNLQWDPEFKKCRIIEKPSLLEDTSGNILGWISK